MRKLIFFIFTILLSSSFALTTLAQDLAGEFEEDAVESIDSMEQIVSRPKIFTVEKCLGRNKKGTAIKKYLMIQYPWSKISNATLEVRIIGPEAAKQPQFCNPVFFKKIYGKLERIDKDIFNKKIGNRRYANDIKYSNDLFHEHGLPEPENIYLGTVKPPAGARADYFYMVLRNPETYELETTLIFHDLEQWAVDSERLAIELKGEPIIKITKDESEKYMEFDKPCSIKLWLLSDGFVVWEETYQWQGAKYHISQKASGKKAISEFDDDEDPQDSARKMEEANNAQPQQDDDEEATDFEDDFGGDF